MARDVAIRGDTIRLGQLLKLAGLVGAGGELKAMLASTPVLVNGEPDNRRGRQLHPGDVVAISGEEIRVVAQPVLERDHPGHADEEAAERGD